MKKVFFLSTLSILTIMLAGNIAVAQTMLIDERVEVDTVEKKFGKNRKHYVHQFMAFGVPAGASKQGAEVKTFSSLDFKFGFRYKRKWSETLASGLEISYHGVEYRLKQNSNKILPDTLLNDKEKILLYNGQIGIYQRFNFGDRGDIIGKFIDIGGSFDYILDAGHYTKNELPDGQVRKVTTLKLPYVEEYYFNAFIRGGYNIMAMYFNYRFNNLFKGEYSLPELPVYHIGVELGF